MSNLNRILVLTLWRQVVMIVEAVLEYMLFIGSDEDVSATL